MYSVSFLIQFLHFPRDTYIRKFFTIATTTKRWRLQFREACMDEGRQPVDPSIIPMLFDSGNFVVEKVRTPWRQNAYLKLKDTGAPIRYAFFFSCISIPFVRSALKWEATEKNVGATIHRGWLFLAALSSRALRRAALTFASYRRSHSVRASKNTPWCL